MNQITNNHLDEEKKKSFSEFLKLNCKKLNLLKNFNHVIKEIMEKDLELSVNVETVNTLKNEFLVGIPETSEKNSKGSEDKENINMANIGSNPKTKRETGNKGAHVQISKKDQGNNKYERDYYNTKQPQYDNYHRSFPFEKRFVNFSKEGQKSYNRFTSFSNRPYSHYQNENFYRSNRYSPQNSTHQNISNLNLDYQERSIY